MKKNYPKISIVTPSFNQGEYLEATIKSVLDQAYPNLEYIIIDGASTDNSVQIIKKYQQKLKYWVSEKDKGQADAINKGFRESSGEIMAWINSDDVLLPGSLNLVANIFMQATDIEWLSAIPTTITREGFLAHRGLRPAYFKALIKRGFHHGAMLGFIMQESTFWRRSVWENSGAKIKNLHYSLDFELWKRFAQHASLVPVFTSLAAYRLNPSRKNTDENVYYQEINFPFPRFFRFFMKPIRFILTAFLRKFRISSKIIFDEKNGQWVYYRGCLENGLACLKPIIIENKKLI